MNRKTGYTKKNRKWPGATLKEQAKNRYIAMWKLANPGRDWPPPKPVPMNPEQKREKNNAYQRAWHEKRRGYPSTRPRLTPEQRKAKKREAQKKWDAKYPERAKEKRQRSYQRNKAARLAYAQKWKTANPDRYRALKREWDKTPKGIALQKNRNSKRRAAMKSCVSTATAAEIKDLLLRATHCRYCSNRFTKTNKPTIDHIVPINKKGAHSIENLTTVCRSCNSAKSDRDLSEFAKRRGMLFLV